jgi:hypothetical protein
VGGIKLGAQIYASFGVGKFECDPSEVTKIIGVAPTTAWLKGDPKPKTAMGYEANGWRLSSALPVSVGVADHVAELLSLIYPRARNLTQLGAMEITLALAIYMDGDDRPAMHLEPGCVSKLGELGAAIDIDLYAV